MVETRTGAVPSSSEWLSMTVSLRAAKAASRLLWVTRPDAAMVEQPESNELASSGARAKQMPEIFKSSNCRAKNGPQQDRVASMVSRASGRVQGNSDCVLSFQRPELDSVGLQFGRQVMLAFSD